MYFISRIIMLQDHIYSDMSIINIDWKTEKRFLSSSQAGCSETFSDKVEYGGDIMIRQK